MQGQGVPSREPLWRSNETSKHQPPLLHPSLWMSQGATVSLQLMICLAFVLVAVGCSNQSSPPSPAVPVSRAAPPAATSTKAAPDYGSWPASLTTRGGEYGLEPGGKQRGQQLALPAPSVPCYTPETTGEARQMPGKLRLLISQTPDYRAHGTGPVGP